MVRGGDGGATMKLGSMISVGILRSSVQSRESRPGGRFLTVKVMFSTVALITPRKK